MNFHQQIALSPQLDKLILSKIPKENLNNHLVNF